MDSVSTGRTAPLRVDTHLAKFSQASTVVLTALAFVFSQPVIVVITAIILGISAFAPRYSPYALLYRGILVPMKLLTPHPVEDDPAPHLFAQGVGMVFLLASSLLLFLTQVTALGWALDLVVFVLSAVNLTVGFCLGCLVYYHLGRWGLMPRVRYEGGFHWRGVRT